MNVYFVCVGNRPHARHVVSSFKDNLDCKVVQITDGVTPELPGIDRVIRRNSYKGKKFLMHFLIDSFAKIKEEHFITTADDCIIQKPFSVDGDYDVAICKRGKPKTNGYGIDFIPQVPYTNGLVIVKHPDFYKDCLKHLEIIGKMDPHFLEWWGDMASIRMTIETGKYKVMNLPEEEYCRIPENAGEGDDSAVLWHYAGDRKWWMDYHGQGVAA